MTSYRNLNIAIKIDLSELNTIKSIDKKIKYINYSINATLDDYLKQLFFLIQDEKTKLVYNQNHVNLMKTQYDIWVDLTGPEEFVTRKKTKNPLPKSSNTVEQILNREIQRLRLNFEEQLDLLKVTLNATEINCFSRKDNGTNLLDKKAFFNKIENFRCNMKHENFVFEVGNKSNKDLSQRYSCLTESFDFSCDDGNSNKHVTSSSSLVFLETENKEQEPGVVQNKGQIPDKNLTQSCSETSCLNEYNDKNKFVISLGSKVLALYDESKNIWKEGSIIKIMDSGIVYDSIEISFNNDNQENFGQILFCVKFDFEIIDEIEKSLDVDNYLQIAMNNESLEQVEINLDLSPMSSQSSENRDLAVKQANKKRKISLEENVESAVKRKKILEKFSVERTGKDNFRIAELDLKCLSPPFDSNEHDVNTKLRNISVRSRVVAFYSLYICSSQGICLFNTKQLSSGTILESPSKENNSRYLILFDDGYVDYALPKDVVPIFDSLNLPRRLSPDQVYFITNFSYISSANEKLYQYKSGEIVPVFFNKRWYNSIFLSTDASLVFLKIELDFIDGGSNKKHEFEFKLCRGSFRFYSVYDCYSSEVVKKIKQNQTISPFEDFIHKKWLNKNNSINNFTSMFSSTQFPDITPKNINPLLMPIIFGWKRLRFFNRRTGKGTVSYTTPCQKSFKNQKEIDSYLLKQDSFLTMDLFSFDYKIEIEREYVSNKLNFKIEDISNNSENVPISCINSIDQTRPNIIEYSVKRRFSGGVLNKNINDGTLTSCDCTDNCRDRLKCSCWKKTFEATLLDSKHKLTKAIGYRGRRLLNKVFTGIFECNSNCKCDCRCSNKVVQNGVSIRLQLFKTEKKGFGVRCLDDIEKGTFICSYTGLLMNEEQSNEQGAKHGDEYFCDLDFLETIKSLNKKEESGEACSNEDIKIKIENFKKENEYQRLKHQLNFNKTNNSEAVMVICLDDSENDDDEQVSEIVGCLNEKSVIILNDEGDNFTENSKLTLDKLKNIKNFSEFLRTNYEEYVIDAKFVGNIGRWLNHSCSPNIFVQNVFTDSHDLKFPTIALFSSQKIKAGEELCWDYNYPIGSIKGRVINCYCDSPICRKRLL